MPSFTASSRVTTWIITKLQSNDLMERRRKSYISQIRIASVEGPNLNSIISFIVQSHTAANPVTQRNTCFGACPTLPEPENWHNFCHWFRKLVTSNARRVLLPNKRQSATVSACLPQSTNLCNRYWNRISLSRKEGRVKIQFPRQYRRPVYNEKKRAWKRHFNKELPNEMRISTSAMVTRNASQTIGHK